MVQVSFFGGGGVGLPCLLICLIKLISNLIHNHSNITYGISSFESVLNQYSTAHHSSVQ